MSEPPIDELLYRIETLERANRRWKALALVSGGILGFMLFLAVASTTVMSMRLMVERDRARQAMEQAIMQEQAARQAAEQAAQQRRQAEQELKGKE